jgi:hypothetical protein
MAMYGLMDVLLVLDELCHYFVPQFGAVLLFSCIFVDVVIVFDNFQLFPCVSG